MNAKEIDHRRALGSARVGGFQHPSAVARSERLIAERDELLANNPKICKKCLDTGALGYPVYSETDEPAVFRCDLYCDCSSGRAARTAATEWTKRRDQEHRQARIAHVIDSAGIPARHRPFTFATYPESDATKASHRAIRFWASGNVGRRPRRNSLYLWGPTGTGKTAEVVSALKALIEERPRAALFWTTTDLLTAIKRTFNTKPRSYGSDDDDEPEDYLAGAQWIPLLVLDDLGVEALTDWSYEVLFSLVDARHSADLVTLFTSNLSLDQLERRTARRLAEARRSTKKDAAAVTDEDLVAAGRFVGRIREMSDVIEVSGPNLRDPDEIFNVKRRAIAAADDLVRKAR